MAIPQLVDEYNAVHREFVQTVQYRNEIVNRCQEMRSRLNQTRGIIMCACNPFNLRIHLFSIIPQKVAMLTTAFFSTVIYSLTFILTLGRDMRIKFWLQQSVKTVKQKALEIPFALYAIFGPQKGFKKYYALKPDDQPHELIARPNSAPNLQV